jgi:hypothetical protein
MSLFTNLGRCQGCFRRCVAIGGGTGGLARAFPGGSGHLKSRCSTLPGSTMAASASSMARNTAV